MSSRSRASTGYRRHQVFDDFMGTDGLYIDLVADSLVSLTACTRQRGVSVRGDVGARLGYDLAD